MLDRELRKGLKGQMRKIATINVAALGRQLVLQQEHCKQLWAEMCAQEQEYVERMQVGAPTAQVRVTPQLEFSVELPIANSSMFVRPRRIAPASCNRCTTNAS